MDHIKQTLDDYIPLYFKLPSKSNERKQVIDLVHFYFHSKTEALGLPEMVKKDIRQYFYNNYKRVMNIHEEEEDTSVVDEADVQNPSEEEVTAMKTMLDQIHNDPNKFALEHNWPELQPRPCGAIYVDAKGDLVQDPRGQCLISVFLTKENGVLKSHSYHV